MKKIGALMIIVILFNFIFCNSSFAEPDSESDTESDTDSSLTGTVSKDTFDSITGEGTSTLQTENGSQEKTISASDSSVGSTIGMFASVIASFAGTIHIVMDHISIDGGLYYTDSKYSAYETKNFTICSLIFGEFLLFNGKIYETNESLNPEVERGTVAKLIDGIKENTLSAFNKLTTVGLALSLFLLIYSLIRVIAADSVKDMAGWKKVLGNWLVCLLFIFFVKYIIIILNTLNDKLMDMLWTVRKSLEESDYENFEYALFQTSVNDIQNASGFVFFAYSLEYAVMVIFELMFFVKYMIRALSLIFLTVIAPIIGIFHAFNVMNGKDNNILKTWLSQYNSLLFLQPIHALIYIIFLFTASQIAINAPLLGLLFLYALYRAEKIVKLMLNMQDGLSISSFFKK
jgi:hypothetical protein